MFVALLKGRVSLAPRESFTSLSLREGGSSGERYTAHRACNLPHAQQQTAVPLESISTL
jgi:hypothetical protein